MRRPDGTVMQSGLTSNPEDYAHEHIDHLVVGVVLALHVSDDPTNASALSIADQRGNFATIDVLATSHGNDNPWIIPNVVVMPSGPTGIDDFCEELPRPSTQLIDGSKLDTGSAGLDINKLDGDFVLVGFIGGSIEQPVMLGYWPHPSNRNDPATGAYPVTGGVNPATGASQTLNQGRRMFRRYRGTKFTVTSKGSVFIDTNEANYSLKGASSGPTRDANDDGGDLQIDVKNNRQLQINFNKPVPLPNDEPSLPQKNPPQGTQTRSTDSTAITANKDQFEVDAGQKIILKALQDLMQLVSKTDMSLDSKNGKVTITSENSEVDVNGNTKIVATAPEVDINANSKVGISTGTMTTTATGNVNTNATGSVSTTSAASIALTAPAITVGGATSPLPLWNVFLIQDAIVWGAVVALCNAIATAAAGPAPPSTPLENTLVSALSTLQGAITPFITQLGTSLIGPPFSSVIARNS